MKSLTVTFLLIAVLSLLVISKAYAERSYGCESASGIEVTLTIADPLKQITWWDHTHSEFNIATYRGPEKTPRSEEKDYLTYFAEDDGAEVMGTATVDNAVMTEAIQGLIYKLEPDFESKSQFRAVEVYHNDGREEDKIEFKCGQL